MGSWQTPRGALVALACTSLSLGCALFAAGPAAGSPTWLPAVDISAPSQEATRAEVALTPTGDAVAVWQRSDGSNEVIQASVRPAGGAWQPPVDLSPAGSDAFEPDVAVTAGGEAVAVWEQTVGADRIAQASVKPAGGAWSSPVDLSLAGQNAAALQVAITPTGDAMAVWQRYDGTNLVVQAATRPGGGTWQQPIDISVTGYDAFEPQLALNAAGVAVAVWRYASPPTPVVQAATKPAGGSWLPPVNLSEPAAQGIHPYLALNEGGDRVAVWEGYDGANLRIQAAGGAWEGPVNLSEAGANAGGPQVGLSATGDALAIWRRLNGVGNTIVESAAKPAGGAWQAPVDLSELGANAAEPQLALTPAGDAVAIWRYDSSGAVIQGTAKPAGGAWRPAVDISTPGEFAAQPRLALTPTGDAVAVWRVNDSSTIDVIQAAGYDATGPELRSLSIPDAGTVGEPLSFSVTPFDVWSPPAEVTWSFGDGGGGTGTAATHTYAQPGTYQVSVSATDGIGNSTGAQGEVTIAAPPAPPTTIAAPPAPPETGTIPPPVLATPTPPPTPEPVIVGHRARVRRGRALLRLRCPGDADCIGRVRLTFSARRPDARRAARRRQIGAGRFAIPAGRARSLAVRLSRSGRALLRDAGRAGLKVRVTGSGVKPAVVALRPAPRR